MMQIDKPNYVYTFIRTDLPIEQQLVQAAHSALEAGRDLGKPKSNSHLILIGVKNQDSLNKISDELTHLNIRYHKFYEPDYNRGYTSLTTEPLEHRPEYFFKHSLYKYRPNKSFSQQDEVHSI